MVLFLSYRRSESRDIVGRIYDRLITHFPIEAVFRDVDSLLLGRPFPTALDEAVSKARAVLVVIGPNWLSATDSTGRRRLDDPKDFVRQEVLQALAAGVVIVPVLVAGAAMPSEQELPEPLRPLVFHHAASVRPDPDFHSDMDRLVAGLARVLDMPGMVDSPAGVRASAGRRVWAALCDIRQFIGHELPAAVMNGGTIRGEGWEPINRGWRVIQEEQAAVPPAVFAASSAVLTDVLQPGLNRFLDTLRSAIAARAEPGYDAQVWVARVDQQLRHVQEEFAGRLGTLAELLQKGEC